MERFGSIAGNDSGIGVVVALMIFLSHTVLQPLEVRGMCGLLNGVSVLINLIK